MAVFQTLCFLRVTQRVQSFQFVSLNQINQSIDRVFVSLLQSSIFDGSRTVKPPLQNPSSRSSRLSTSFSKKKYSTPLPARDDATRSRHRRRPRCNPARTTVARRLAFEPHARRTTGRKTRIHFPASFHRVLPRRNPSRVPARTLWDNERASERAISRAGPPARLGRIRTSASARRPSVRRRDRYAWENNRARAREKKKRTARVVVVVVVGRTSASGVVKSRAHPRSFRRIEAKERVSKTRSVG